METVDYFNFVAHKWDSMVYHDAEKIENLLGILNIGKGNSVLDVGTGTGVLIPFLCRAVGKRGKVVGVDVAENMIKTAKQKFDFYNVEFVVADILTASLKQKRYDYVICYSMFPHFKDKALTIKKLSSYLSKNGKLAIFHSQSRSEINALHEKNTTLTSASYLPDANEIESYFHSNGLKTFARVDNKDMFAVVGEK
ncbi:MAG TPA: class I SAM-dependent methyltransferase [Clostridia bacterium]|nr:class I SAM-dependent methyltransferase [Clostridia bacterium]